MSVFDKSAIGILGLSVVGAAAVVLALPIDETTHSPRASFTFNQIETAAGTPTVIIEHTPQPAGQSIKRRRQVATNPLNYDLDQLRDGRRDVPPVFIVSLPADLRTIRVPKQRKQIFFKAVLPLVLKINADISRDRNRLIAIRKQVAAKRPLVAHDRLWLAAQTEKYGLDRNDLRSLAARMDVVPPSLAMAQAAEESGWGTSRFAVEGNAIFGQWTFTEASNFVPRRRDADRAHRVRRFTRLIDAVAAYVHNLNTHRAYREFRSARATMRRGDRPLSGSELAGTMIRYSARGVKYVRTIRTIINANKLGDFDRVRLSAEVTARNGKPVI